MTDQPIVLTIPKRLTGKPNELNVLRGLSVRREGLSALDDNNRKAYDVFADMLEDADIRFEPGSQAHSMNSNVWARARADCNDYLANVRGSTNTRTHVCRAWVPNALSFIRSGVNGGSPRISMMNETPTKVGAGKEMSTWEEYFSYVNSEMDGATTAEKARFFVQTAHAPWQWQNQIPPQQQTAWDAVVGAIQMGIIDPGGIATTQKAKWGGGYKLWKDTLDVYDLLREGMMVHFTEWNAYGDPHADVHYANALLNLSRLFYETRQVEAFHYHEGFNAKTEGPLIVLDPENGTWRLSPTGVVYRALGPLLQGRWADLRGERPDELAFEGYFANRRKYIAWANLGDQDHVVTLGKMQYVCKAKRWGIKNI